MSEDNSKSELPECGLYRTTKPLPGKEQWVRKGILVFFHNHSQQGPPLILLPAANEGNRWQFHDQGYLVRQEEYLETLVPLKAEGFYILNEPIHLSSDEFIPERTLLQLGYNRGGEPIIFLGQFTNNSITFPESGLKCTLEIFELLDEVGFRVPREDREE